MATVSGTIDVFEIIEQGKEPPAPLLCAALLHSQQEYGRAAGVYSKQLDKLDVKELPLSNEDLLLKADLLESLAQITLSNGDPLEALALYERALHLHELPRPPTPPPPEAPDSDEEESLGVDTPPTPDSEATPAEPSPPLIEQPAEKKNLAVAGIQGGCAGCLESLGRPGDAANRWTLALASYGACGQGNTAEAGDALFSLAKLKLKLGLDSEARPLLEQCMQVETKLFGAQHVRTDQVRRVLDELRDPLRWSSPDPNESVFTVEVAIKQVEG